MSDEDVRRVRQIAERVLWDECEVERVRKLEGGTAEGEVLLQISGDAPSSNRNAFAGRKLAAFIEEGYLPTSVGGGEDSMSAWFQPMGVGITIQ